MADRPLRDLERGRELRGARSALVQERDDAPACRVRDRAEPFGLLDREDVVEVVVRKTVDGRGTYGKSRPFARGDAGGSGFSLIPVEVDAFARGNLKTGSG